MMAENYTYARSNVIARSPLEPGLFGVPCYVEGECIHELKELSELAPWMASEVARGG